MATLAKLELDAQDVEQEVGTWLRSGATVSLFSRSSGSGEKNHMTFKPSQLESENGFTAAEIVHAFRDRAKLFWDSETNSNQVAADYSRTKRGQIDHYIKVRGKAKSV